MNGVWSDRFRAVAVLLLIVGLVGGVPYLLITLVGNPFPASLPSADELRILLTQNGQGFANFIIGTLAVLIWIIWAQLMIALVVEVAATLSRSQSRRLPLAPGIQSFAAQLIAALTLATTLAAAPLMTSAAGALELGPRVASAPAISTQVVPAAAADTELGDVVQADRNKELSGQASLTLSDSTELWDLAESAYGDGILWKEIAAANSGRIDAGGQRITESTEVVAEGTQLFMPGDIEADELSAFGVSHDQVVAPGDSMWSLAEEHVEGRLGRPATDAEISEYWSDVVSANPEVSSGNADLIYPGETLTLPGSTGVNQSAAVEGAKLAMADDEHHWVNQGAGESAAPQVVTEDADAMADVTVVGDASVEEAVIEDAAVEDVVVEDVVVEEATFDGVGSEPGGLHDVTSQVLVPAPVPSVAVPVPLEPTMQSVAGANSAESESLDKTAVGLTAVGSVFLLLGAVGAIRRRRDLQRRTRPAGVAARRPSTEAAAFEAAMLHATSELRESECDGGWRALPASAVDAMRQTGPVQIHGEASGLLHAIAVTDLDGETTVHPFDLTAEVPPEAGANTPSVIPTSLIVGTHRRSGEAVLLDLASAGQLGLQGSPADVRRFARSAIVDLAFSERADDLQVIAVGVGRELKDLERVRLVDDFGEALAAAVSSGHVGEPSTPLVVVSTIDAEPIVDELTELGVIVVAPGLETRAQVVIDGDDAELLPAGTPLHLASLSDDHYRSMAELVEVTSASALELVENDMLSGPGVDVAPAEECPVAQGPVDVRILGPVEIAGADSFSSLKAVDVIAYLAFHRNGVDADQIKSWVWPTFEPPTDKALANVMSRARTGLGANSDGEPYLSRAGADKTYRLSPAVTTDFDRFRALVSLADDEDEPTNQLALLKRALELIRGVPFTGGTASSFAWADNHVRAQVEFTIDETVHRCADLALELGDVATARWSALKGLELVPGCEQCFRRRFLVARADNNRTELRRAMADLERSAAIDLGEPEAVDVISIDLLDLYHQLDRALVGGAS